jgi:hypothetical protein
MTASSADEIRSFVRRAYLEPARRQGLKHVRIIAGDVHRSLKLKNRVPNVCNALTSKSFLRDNNVVIEEESGPPSGMGTRMTYTYRLLGREHEQPGAIAEAPAFDKLRGLLKEALHSLGGGERFLQRERNSFYGGGRAEDK